MRVFATSKNTGPTWSGPDPVTLVYLGTSVEKAEEAVGTFSRYQRPEVEFKNFQFPDIYNALPKDVDCKMVKFYMADGWWYSIVEFELEET